MGINCYYCNCVIKGDIKQRAHPSMRQILIQCCPDCYEIQRIEDLAKKFEPDLNKFIDALNKNNCCPKKIVFYCRP